MGEAISEVVLVSYDPAWPAAFRQERRRLLGAVGSNAEAVHHVGSTSVPGMPAKPVIDMLMEVTDLDTLDDQSPALAGLGYEAMGEYGLPGRRYFRRWRDGRHTHHLHAYASGDPAVARHVIFRDFLRRRPQIAARYGSLKQRLAETLAHRRRDYAAGKAPFVEAVECEALAWAEAAGRRVSGVDTVLFDADGVVQRTGDGWRSSLAALCADQKRVDDFLAEVFAAERPCLLGHGDFPESLAQVLRRWNSPASLTEALRIWQLIEPDADVLERVQTLRRAGLATALASNQQRYRARYMTEQLRYASCFDQLFYSCELGQAKPSAGYFNAVVRRLGTLPAQVLFLDDHQANVQAARECGLAAEVYHLDQGPALLERLLDRHNAWPAAAG